MAQRSVKPFRLENPANGWIFETSGLFSGCWLRKVKKSEEEMSDEFFSELAGMDTSNQFPTSIDLREQQELRAAKADLKVRILREIRTGRRAHCRKPFEVFESESQLSNGIAIVRRDLDGKLESALFASRVRVSELARIDESDDSISFALLSLSETVPSQISPGAASRRSPHRPGAPYFAAA